MLLEIQNLHIDVNQNDKPLSLCRNLNFSVGEGETVGILGESGSGKSLTALSILRLLAPSISLSGGSIKFTRNDGSTVDLVNVSLKTLQSIRGKEISMVFQEPMSSLNPVFTCGEQVLEAIRKHKNNSYKEAYNEVITLFKKVKLPDPGRIFQSYPHQLSGGQKQRVMIAIAISCNPRLLIADEPTTALDVTVQKSILDLLKELQAEMGMSIMFITHDLSVIAEISQRILVFYRGEIVEQGDVKQLLSNAQHPYTQGLLGCRSSLHTKGERLKTLDDFFEGETFLPKPIHQNEQIYYLQKEVLVNENILTIRDLCVAFGKKQILHNINFDVFKGETLGLVGESGSGKTTIGRTIMKLIDTLSGNIKFHGNSINNISSKELKNFRKNVQIIFQDPYSSLNPKITVGETIAEPLIVHNLYKNARERKQRVLELLRQVNLKDEHYNRYPHQFSGGQRQRIGIARALAVEPEVIILDESVSALDVSIQAQILNLLNDLKQIYNLTYIFISHDLNTVRYMADRVIVLKDGVVVEEGVPEELFESPRSPYTANLIASIPGKFL
ncbi:MAG: ABC transporter ATP-binding protein [Bacteroidota bacterium]|nr:ABC transporter ATP-binding protein [Bacteroidota bacterium]